LSRRLRPDVGLGAGNDLAFNVAITREAKRQLANLSAAEQRLISHEIAARVHDQPTRVTRALKKLRPNPLAGFELRIGDLRVLYNVDVASTEVVIVAVGRKMGNALIVDGEDSVDTKVIPLSDLQADTEGVLTQCYDLGQSLVIELPNRGLISIQPVDPHDDLVNDLIEHNAGFRNTLAKSLASPREPFPFSTSAGGAVSSE
jgi:mRNA-degrading endonuclease RelE of RelBE toxin-antitoxin system